jgi:DNA repair photolyase
MDADTGAEDNWRPIEVLAHKGRGAVSNRAGRYQTDPRETVDDGWYDDDEAPSPPPTVVTVEHARSIISRNDSPDIPFTQSVNPYRGCEHGCVYCYARPNHARLGLSPGLDFETRLFAKTNAAALLSRELAVPGYRCESIMLAAATDGWQPIEREHRISRACLEVLSACRHPVSLITKSSLVERDIDLLAPMARDGLAAAWVTVTTLDPTLARILEPRAAAPWRRLETIRRLAEAGIPTGVSVAPVIPFVNEPEIESILEAAREAGARHGSYVLLRLPWELKEVFADWLAAHFPERAARVMARLRDMRGGRDNDPRFRSRMRGHGPFAELVRMRFDARLRKLGMDGDRLTLRTDLFVPPAAAPRSRPGRAAAADTAQLGLF